MHNSVSLTLPVAAGHIGLWAGVVVILVQKKEENV